MKFDERNQKIYKIPPFLFAMATAKICEVWSEFNIFYTLVTMATAAILNFSNPQKLPHTNGGYSYKVSKEFMCCIGMEYVVDMENINKRTNHNKMLHATSC